MVAEWRIREKNEESLLGISYNRLGIVDRINVKNLQIVFFTSCEHDLRKNFNKRSRKNILKIYNEIKLDKIILDTMKQQSAAFKINIAIFFRGYILIDKNRNEVERGKKQFRKKKRKKRNAHLRPNEIRGTIKLSNKCR